MPNVMRVFALALLIFLGMFTATALAAGVATSVAGDNQSLLDLAKPVFDAITHGQWMLSAALVVVLLCAIARKYMPDAWTTGAKGDVVGIGLAFAMSFAGAIATMFAAPGASMSWAVLTGAAKIAVAAAGGYTILHKLATAFMSTAWYQAKAPAWLKTVLSLAMSAVGSDAVAKAEAAGVAAVAATPSTGIAGPDGIKEVS